MILHLYAIGYFTNFYTNFSDQTSQTQWLAAFFLLVWPFIKEGYDFCIHRGMHPWNTTTIPDIGYYLYKYGHEIHHISTNMNTWTGLSLHPLEAFPYFFVMLTPLLIYNHPILFFICKISLMYTTVLSHDGYDFPGKGDWDHFVHH